MDYEKKIREYMNSSKLYKDILSILFPELADGEDENVRKALIDICRRTIPVVWNRYSCNKEEALAWLEKQDKQTLANSAKTCKDEQKSWSEEDDSILSDIVNHFDGFPLKHQTHEIFGWFVSLKQRIGG